MLEYPQYYNLARQNYLRENPNQKDSKPKLYELGAQAFNPSNIEKNAILNFPTNYQNMIENIQKEVDERLKNSDNCYFPSNVKKEKDVALHLNNIWKINELQELCDFLVPQIESKIFGCYVHVMKVSIYRSLVTNNPPITSWLWHYDSNPREFIKLLIYLTDVTEKSGPFEYLEHQENAKAFMGTKIRTGFKDWNKEPQWSDGRVPSEEIEKLQKEGYKPKKVVGEKGTMILANTNCIHRATLAEEHYRDIMVLIMKPSKEKLRPIISPKWTGTAEHNPITIDPSLLKPIKSKDKAKLFRGATRRLKILMSK